MAIRASLIQWMKCMSMLNSLTATRMSKCSNSHSYHSCSGLLAHTRAMMPTIISIMPPLEAILMNDLVDL